MERTRCTKCGAIYTPTEKKCPKCGAVEGTKINLPDGVWEE